MEDKYKFYNVSEASIKLNSSERMVTEYIRSGQLKAYKNIGKWYILPIDLYNFAFGGAVDSDTYNGKRSKEKPAYLKPKAKVTKMSTAQKKQIIKELNLAKKKQFKIDDNEDFRRRIREYEELNRKYEASLRNAYIDDLPKPKKYDIYEGFVPITELPEDYELLTTEDIKDSEPTPTPTEHEPLTIDDIK